jgi:uncharacterized phage infection (PIP) family protein YhgE
LSKELDNQNQKIKEQQHQIDQLTKSTDEQTKLAKDRQEKIEQLNDELQQAHQTASLATKLQVLRESDLKDLQERYKESIETQERQHQLLSKLEERLRAAAQYFNKFQENRNLFENPQQAIAAPKRRTTKRSRKKAE